jgi:hypothetical protein
MADRYFPATASGEQVYIDASAQDETVVDTLAVRVGHRKVRTAEEMREVIAVSERGLPAIRLWIHEKATAHSSGYVRTGTPSQTKPRI